MKKGSVYIKFDDVLIGNSTTREFYHISNSGTITRAHQLFDEFFEHIAWTTEGCRDIRHSIGHQCMLGSATDGLGAHAGMLATFLCELEISCIDRANPFVFKLTKIT
jgi:hypothetical protein